MSLNSGCMLLWWICSIDCDYVSLIEYLCTTMDRHSRVLLDDILLIVMEIIQLDNDDDARDLIMI
jgi:hypothetical protein